MKTHPKPERDMIARMVFSTAVAMIFTQAAGVVAGIIDGVMTSRFIGQSAYSAVTLFAPFTGTLLLLSGFLATGSQVVCSRLVGMGEQKEANAVFFLTARLALLVSGLMLAGCVFFPHTLFSACGISVETHPEIYLRMQEYLHGYMAGIPALMLIQVLGPIVAMDGGKKIFSLSAAVFCLTDIAGDLLNATVFHGGNFGMGLATAISFLVQLTMLLCYFFRKDSQFHFSRGRPGTARLKEVLRAGSPTFVRKLATVLRDLLINRMHLSIALSTAAVAARGVQNDLNTLMFCIGLGVGQAALAIGGVFYGAQDRKGLRRVFSASMKTSLLLGGGAAVLCFAGADVLSGLYLNNPEAADLAAFSLRCMALSLILDALLVTLSNYLQAVENRMLVNLMNFGERLIIPVLTAFIMGRFFGSRGILASIAVSKALLALLVLGILWVKNRHFPHCWEDFMLLPKSFGGVESDSLYASLHTQEEVMRESMAAEEFILARGAGIREARLVALFVEEMGGNIIQHGKPRNWDRVCVDLRLYAGRGKITLSLRDYCEAFDPGKYAELHRSDDPGKNIGIRMVMHLARDARHIYTFNSNCLLLSLDLDPAADPNQRTAHPSY